MGLIKDRNGKDITAVEEIKKKWQEYMSNVLMINDWDNLNSVVTHLEPGILECKVKWSLGSMTMNKASEDDGIPAVQLSYFKS